MKFEMSINLFNIELNYLLVIWCYEIWVLHISLSLQTNKNPMKFYKDTKAMVRVLDGDVNFTDIVTEILQ